MGKLVVNKIRASGLKVRKYGGSEQPDIPDEPGMVTIRFNRMDGTGVISEQMECGTPLTAPEIGNRNGYEFTGWVPEVPSAVPQTDTEFTAQWSPIQYTITYNMNGHGEVPSGALTSYTVESDEYIPHSPAPVDGWTFNGWTPDRLPAGGTGDFTFTANWAEQEEQPSIYDDPELQEELEQINQENPIPENVPTYQTVLAISNEPHSDDGEEEGSEARDLDEIFLYEGEDGEGEYISGPIQEDMEILPIDEEENQNG